MRFAAIILCAALALPAASAQAASGLVDWPTFFRVGPSKHDRVVAELLRGTAVGIRSCDDQWCLVQYGRALGYVERWTLNAKAVSPPTPASSGCFDSVRSGYGKGETLRFCPR